MAIAATLIILTGCGSRSPDPVSMVPVIPRPSVVTPPSGPGLPPQAPSIVTEPNAEALPDPNVDPVQKPGEFPATPPAKTVVPKKVTDPESEIAPDSDTEVWIKPYTKLDGTPVKGHWRRKTAGELNSANAGAGFAKPSPGIKAPASRPTPTGGGGGSVHVKGFTRKDGTYVAPHTRHAPKSGK